VAGIAEACFLSGPFLSGRLPAFGAELVREALAVALAGLAGRLRGETFLALTARRAFGRTAAVGLLAAGRDVWLWRGFGIGWPLDDGPVANLLLAALT
jgi:hypothetical protein